MPTPSSQTVTLSTPRVESDDSSILTIMLQGFGRERTASRQESTALSTSSFTICERVVPHEDSSPKPTTDGLLENALSAIG